MINVGIIDSDYLTRTMVRMLLTNQNQKDIAIIFELDKLPSVGSVNDLGQPHLVLVDLKDSSPRLVKSVKFLFPTSYILVLSDFWKVDIVYEALRNGAVSYLRKATCLNNILYAVLTTCEGGSVLSPCISKEIVSKLYTTRVYEDLLSARELQVAKGIINGLSYKMVADNCAISLDTVRVYVKRIYRKLNINSKGELISQFKG